MGEPKGILVAQQSWRPDVALYNVDVIPRDLLGKCPIAMVTFEAGVDLKEQLVHREMVHCSFEIQAAGGVYVWGNGTYGQLGLGGIENEDLVDIMENPLTKETHASCTTPAYVSGVHELEVRDIAAGGRHAVAVTASGVALAWGSADAVGVPLPSEKQDFPVFVEQLETLVESQRCFAGHTQSYILAEMPQKSVFKTAAYALPSLGASAAATELPAEEDEEVAASEA